LDALYASARWLRYMLPVQMKCMVMLALKRPAARRRDVVIHRGRQPRFKFPVGRVMKERL